jgi:hypothetical protein
MIPAYRTAIMEITPYERISTGSQGVINREKTEGLRGAGTISPERNFSPKEHARRNLVHGTFPEISRE